MKSKFFLGLVLIVAMMVVMPGCAKKAKDTAQTPAATQQTEPTDPQDLGTDNLTPEQIVDMKVLTENRIYFDFDKFDLKPEAKEVLKAKAAVLKKYAGWKMLVEGHCDERGTEEYNLALGERRARAAYEFLVVLGVPSSRLKIVSFGEERPAVSGSTEAAWAKNRRDAFKVFK